MASTRSARSSRRCSATRASSCCATRATRPARQASALRSRQPMRPSIGWSSSAPWSATMPALPPPGPTSPRRWRRSTGSRSPTRSNAFARRPASQPLALMRILLRAVRVLRQPVGGSTLPGGRGRGAGNRTRAAWHGAAAGGAAQRDVAAGGHAPLTGLAQRSSDLLHRHDRSGRASRRSRAPGSSRSAPWRGTAGGSPRRSRTPAPARISVWISP